MVMVIHDPCQSHTLLLSLFLYTIFISPFNRGVTGKIFRGGKIIFPDFLPGVKCFFPVENFHFGRPKTNFIHFWKVKKNKNKNLSSFCNFSFHFKYFTSAFSIFLLFHPISLFNPCIYFPDRSIEISWSEVFLFFGGGALCLPATPPPPGTLALLPFNLIKNFSTGL